MKRCSGKYIPRTDLNKRIAARGGKEGNSPRRSAARAPRAISRRMWFLVATGSASLLREVQSSRLRNTEEMGQSLRRLLRTPSKSASRWPRTRRSRMNSWICFVDLACQTMAIKDSIGDQARNDAIAIRKRLSHTKGDRPLGPRRIGPSSQPSHCRIRKPAGPAVGCPGGRHRLL